MAQLLLGVVIGIIIGWNWPQPAWARALRERVVKLARLPERQD